MSGFQATAALAFGYDRCKQSIEFDITEVLQRTGQVLWQEVARVRSRIAPVEIPG